MVTSVDGPRGDTRCKEVLFVFCRMSRQLPEEKRAPLAFGRNRITHPHAEKGRRGCDKAAATMVRNRCGGGGLKSAGQLGNPAV
eukprot:6204373-Pleurochrysis_carterae.AAC.1